MPVFMEGSLQFADTLIVSNRLKNYDIILPFSTQYLIIPEFKKFNNKNDIFHLKVCSRGTLHSCQKVMPFWESVRKDNLDCVRNGG